VSKLVDAGGLRALTIRDVTAHRATARAFHDSEERFRLISELSTEGLVLTERGVIFHANKAMTALFGYTREELVGMSPMDLTAPQDREVAAAHVRSGSDEPYAATGVRKDGSTFVGSISGTSLPYQGRVVRGTRIRDISAQRQADEARRQAIAQEEKLRIQEERLAEMSTPLMWITKEILAMPLVGTMDMARARQALKTMLDGIAKSDAHTAIVDITGMSGVDTSVVSSLVRLAQAVRLQGAQVVLTGIRPQVADTLVTLDVNLTGIVIKGSFQDGIRYAMKRGREGRAAADLDG
jgi:rsbT co-antagonist protein RsbR